MSPAVVMPPDLVIRLLDVAGELRVTAQGIDLLGLSIDRPQADAAALIAELRRRQPGVRPLVSRSGLSIDAIRDAIDEAWGFVDGRPSMSDVAALLGVDRTTLWRYLNRHDLTFRDLLQRSATHRDVLPVQHRHEMTERSAAR